MASGADRRVFVAGAAGAIGRPLCRLLVADGWIVTGTTRSAERARMLEAMGVTPAIVDVFDAAALARAVADAAPGLIVHQLTDLPARIDASTTAEAFARNARIREIGTRNLATAGVAVGIRRLVAQSIAFAYAPGPTPYTEDSPLNTGEQGTASARAVASLEHQVLNGPFAGVVLRYGRLYGPGTGSPAAKEGGPVHVDAAADAARRALTRGAGVYNVAEADGTVSSVKAERELGWDPAFRAA